MSSPRYGKYKAIVIDVADPQERGRVKVTCPRVMGNGHSKWCEVCSPVAYEGGGDFCLPKVGDTVWIEFEEGDPTRPIWVGGWWSTASTPNKNYANAEKLRIVEFDGCRIEMQEGQIKMSIKDSENCIILNKQGIQLVVTPDCTIKLG